MAEHFPRVSAADLPPPFHPLTGALGLQTLDKRVGSHLTTAACVAFVLMLFSGDVKASLTWVPFDLTTAAAGSAFVLSLLSFLIRKGTIRTQVVWMMALFFLMSISSLWTEWTPYGIDKATRLFTIVLMVAILPAFILTETRDIKRFISWVVGLAILISIGTLVEILNGGPLNQGTTGATGFSAGTISSGRNAGIALVGMYALVLTREKGKLLPALLCLPLVLVLLGSGSRGPLLFALGVILFLTLRFSMSSRRSILTVLVLLAAGGFTLYQFSSLLPGEPVARVQTLFEHQYDASAEERVLANHAAIEEIGNSPLGLGFGGFARVYSFGRGTGRVYPHNIVLEMAVENGSFVAAFFLFVVALAVLRSYRAAVRDRTLCPLFAVLLFTLGNALVSGDLSDNRIIHAVLCISLLLPAIQAATHGAESESIPLPLEPTPTEA